MLDKLLSKAGEPFDTIRQQLAHASISSRKFSGVGFFTHFAIPWDAPVRRDLRSTELGDVGGKIPGVQDGVGFLLFILVTVTLLGHRRGDE